jgi:hypothetical protein
MVKIENECALLSVFELPLDSICILANFLPSVTPHHATEIVSFDCANNAPVTRRINPETVWRSACDTSGLIICRPILAVVVKNVDHDCALSINATAVAVNGIGIAHAANFSNRRADCFVGTTGRAIAYYRTAAFSFRTGAPESTEITGALVIQVIPYLDNRVAYYSTV